MSKKTKEVSSVTMQDLYKKLGSAIEKKMDRWCYMSFVFPEEHKAWAYFWDRESELDFIEFSYTVNENDEVEVSEPTNVKLTALVTSENSNINIEVKLDETAKLLSQKETEISNLKVDNENLTKDLAEKNDALVKAGEKIGELTNVVSELTPFKEKVEEAEKQAKEAEIAEKKVSLKKLAIKGGYITEDEIETSEVVKEMIENLDEQGIKALIAERLIKKLDETIDDSEVETSEIKQNKEIKTNLVDDEDMIDHKSIMKSFLNK